MLSEIEAKVLRIILNNWRTKGRTPSVRDLEIRTGRDTNGVLHVLNTLQSQQLIKWNVANPDRIVVDEYKCAQRGF